MADNPINNINMSGGVHTADEILKLSEDYYNVQKKIEESEVRQNNNLLKMFGMQKSLVSSWTDMVNKTQDLEKSINKTNNLESEMIGKLRSEAEPSKRREMEYFIRSIKQRRAAYEAELQYNKMLVSSGIYPLIIAFNEVWKLFKTMDEAAAKFRMTVGMIRDTSKAIRAIVERTAVDYMHLGVTVDSAYTSVISLGNAIGSMHSVTKELVATTSIFKSQLGIAEEDSANFLKNMAGVSKSTVETQKNMSYLAGYMSNIAGIPLSIVMKEIASASGNTLTMMSRIPMQVVKSVIELKRMGTSLKQAADSGRQILNFQESVNAEMEASVLLGRSINLQRARELAYRRDTVGVTKEILNLSRKIDFENLDVFQQEAFAKAVGKNVDELTNMLVASRELEKARRSSDPSVQKMVRAYDEMEMASKNTLMTESEKFKLNVMQKSNQSTLLGIQQKWNQLLTKVGYILLPPINAILGFISNNLDGIINSFGIVSGIMLGTLPIINGMSSAISFFASKMGKAGVLIAWMAKGLQAASGFITGFSDRITLALMNAGRYGIGTMSAFDKILIKLNKVRSFFGNIGSKVSGFLGIFGKFGPMISGLSKFLGPLGAIITAFQAINGFIDGWKSGNGILDSLGKGLWGGVKAVVIPIYDMLIYPFKKAKEWISGYFTANSPSKLGLGIVKGLSSVGDMMENAITTPFSNAYTGMKDISKSFHNELSDMVRTPLRVPIETNISSVYDPGSKVRTNDIATSPISDKKSDVKDSSKETDDVSNSEVCLKNILDAINNLNSNLMNGKIGLYLDGQLLSATLARQTEFRNGFGTNRIS